MCYTMLDLQGNLLLPFALYIYLLQSPMAAEH